MSWGYFLDLRLSLPTAEWNRLKTHTSRDHVVSPGWWHFRDKALEGAFLQPVYETVTFEEAFAWFRGNEEAVCRVDAKGGTTSIRLATLLDKSGELYVARPFASLLEAARTVEGSAGSIALVNDGTYSGEGGAEVSLQRGKLTAKRIRDDWEERMEALMGEVFGDEVFEGLPRVEKKATAKKAPAKRAPAKRTTPKKR